MKAVDIRPGVALELNGKLYVVVKIDHTKPGKGPAYMQVKAKDVATGSHIEKRFGTSESVEATTLDRRTAEYLYDDGTGYVFMDNETFDQFTLSYDLAGDSMQYLRPNATATVMFHGETPIVVELPASVELEITETTPTVKGATATNQLKEATLETGLKTRVPPFIEIGETVRISTEDSSYQSRVKV